MEDYLNWDPSYRNDNNETALHVAISNDASIHTLRAIFEKGVDVNVKNNAGKSPFECINHGSWKTALNLLQLEKDFDLTDDNRDTFLHVLLDRVGDSVWGIRNPEFGQRDQEQMISIFWSYILKHIEKFTINVNSQNKYGQTPLHIAADYWHSMKSLEEMLSHFEHVDPFICDNDGENFLHVYVRRHRRQYVPWFHDKLMKGRLKYLPKERLCKLFNSQTRDKDTPLHILIKEGDTETLMDYEDILQAGSDPSISDCLGEISLHCVLKKYNTQLEEDQQQFNAEVTLSHEPSNEIIKCLVSHGANVNAVNKRGESPIFLARHQEHINTLVSLGADINLRNNCLQTPMLYFVGKENVKLKTLQNLLINGADVYASDTHGNTVLHYIAWHGYHKEFLSLLNAYDIKGMRDKLGKLPCDVAYMKGHKAIFDELCICSAGSHAQPEYFNLTNDVINLTTLIENPKECQNELSCIQTYRNDQLSKLLTIPGIGAVDFEGEASDIKSVTEEMVKCISEKIAEKNEFLKCRIVQSGSVVEKTKVESPNEFDFIIILEMISKMCCIDEQHSDQEYVSLQLKKEYAAVFGEYAKYFDDELYLKTEDIRSELCEIIDDLFIREGPFQHPNIFFAKGDSNSMIRPTIEFTYYWKGCLYKELLVSIDLVPACQIEKYWPPNSNFGYLESDTKSLEEQGALLLFQTELTDSLEYRQSRLRISAMSAEKEHMLNLPRVARDAYKVCKALCNERVCPKLHVRRDIPIKKVLTSYMLKNTMFHVMKNMKESEQVERCENKDNGKQAQKETQTLHVVVKKIFLNLLQFIRDEHLPAFVFPWQNVFTFNVNMLPLHNHWLCAMRYAFVKIILSMLGEVQDFSDIDEPSCLQAVEDRDSTDESSDDRDSIDKSSDDSDIEEIDNQVFDFENPPRTFYYKLL